MQNKLVRSTIVGNRQCGKHQIDTVADKDAAKLSVPEIKISRENGRIASIVIRCTCGEQILIECDYEG